MKIMLVICAFKLLFVALQCVGSKSKYSEVTPRVACTSRHMHALFGPAVRDNLQVKDRSGASKAVFEANGQCGVRGEQESDGSISVYSLYNGCYTYIESHSAVVTLRVQLVSGDQWYLVNITCPLSQKPNPNPSLAPGNCKIQKALRVDCGPKNISRAACLKLGCCYYSFDTACYYRMDACSLDGNFVFSVKASDYHPPLSVSSLAVKGHPQCIPVATTPYTAIFKFGVNECGARRVVNEMVVSYEVEVETLNDYTTMAEESHFSLRVQCQYARLVQVRLGLVSKDATPPPPASALGTIKLQMRIATDSSFSSFVPRDRLPLILPLQKPVYVEVSLVELYTEPRLSLFLHHCFAYPASRHSMWTLLYNGCPDPMDSLPSSVLVGQTTSHAHVKRFDVKTFAFIDPATGEPSTEELYFSCWVEICAEASQCQLQCTNSSDGGRLRRESRPISQLVSLGPVLLVQNVSSTSQREQTGATVYQVFSVYSLSVSTAILFFLLYSVWSRSRSRQQSSVSEEPNVPVETDMAAVTRRTLKKQCASNVL